MNESTHEPCECLHCQLAGQETDQASILTEKDQLIEQLERDNAELKRDKAIVDWLNDFSEVQGITRNRFGTHIKPVFQWVGTTPELLVTFREAALAAIQSSEKEGR